jgi:pseudouridine synthase
MAPFRDESRGIRLTKALAAAGVGSRRACEQLIEETRVAVNGVTITDMPAWVDPDTDRITVDGARVNKPRKGAHHYILVHKPRHVLCTNSDPENRRTIIDLVPHPQRLFCVGRLDSESTGLVLLTDDGALANHLTHPKYGIAKTYEVTVRGALTGADIEKMQAGIFLTKDSRKKSPYKKRVIERQLTAEAPVSKVSTSGIQIIARDREKTRLLITLREGRNREIRRMLARLGYNVRKLKRVGLGPLRLKGVASGQWRKLTHNEVSSLRQAARRAQQRAKRMGK